MSWFGSSGSSKSSSGSSYDSSSYSNQADHSSDYSASSSYSAPSASSYASSSSGQNLQSELVKMQEQVVVQQFVSKLANIAFENCVTKPSSSLSSSEQACVRSFARKYVEATQFMQTTMSDQN